MTGLPVHHACAKKPGDVRLEGRFGAVEKLDALRHGADLWHAVRGADHLWTYLPYGPFEKPSGFDAWLTERALLEDPLAYAILDREGRAFGLTSLMAIRLADRVMEVGHVLYAPALQRTALATEAQYLLMAYAFDVLGFRRYEWKCDSMNENSRRAATRLGFTFEGIFRQHMIRKGRNRDTAWFSMLDSEWPQRKAAFERWLRPENFSTDGQQKTRLTM